MFYFFGDFRLTDLYLVKVRKIGKKASPGSAILLSLMLEIFLNKLIRDRGVVFFTLNLIPRGTDSVS